MEATSANKTTPGPVNVVLYVVKSTSFIFGSLPAEWIDLSFALARSSRILWTESDFGFDGELFLSTVFRPGDTVIDVGANIGVLSLLTSRLLGLSGRVLAIEAHPRTYLALLNNLKRNSATKVTLIFSRLMWRASSCKS